MKCPYCQKELIEGHIYGDMYSLKWLPSDKKLFFGVAIGSEVLPSVENSLRPKVRAHKYHEYQKLIVDLK